MRCGLVGMTSGGSGMTPLSSRPPACRSPARIATQSVAGGYAASIAGRKRRDSSMRCGLVGMTGGGSGMTVVPSPAKGRARERFNKKARISDLPPLAGRNDRGSPGRCAAA